MKKILFIVLVIICFWLFFTHSFVYSQKKDFVYKKSPYSQIDNLSLIQNKQEIELLNSAIDLTKYLPKDFVKDASKDYTAYIQKGLDENEIVKMPNCPLLVNEKGLNIKSGSKILFQKNSSLTMKPNSLTNYSVLEINN